MFDPATLASMARHWATGMPLPKATLDRVQDLQTYMRGYGFARRLTQSLADLELHGEYVPGGARSASDVFRNAFATNMVSRRRRVCCLHQCSAGAARTCRQPID